MLEIYLVWRLANYIGNEATRKGLKKGRYQFMAVLLWILGEFGGAILGSAIFTDTSSVWPTYGIAILGAVLGAGTAFLVMKVLPLPVSSENLVPSVIGEEPVISNNFARSGWIPALVIILAFFCFCLVLGGAVAIQM